MAAPAKNLANKIVVVTGASSGIGKATAAEFARLGSYLVITGRDREALASTEGECRQLGCSDILTVIGDLTVEEDCVKLIEKTVQRFGRLDVLVNNAGIQLTGSVENTSLEQYDQVMNVNVRSVYYLTMLAVPHLIASKGAIVNVSSSAGLRAFPGVLAYCMSKSVIDQFTRCVALELAPKQVRVNSVNPAIITTNLHRRAGQTEEEYAQFIKRSEKTHPLGRVGEPQEVAKAIAFLASSDASFSTGVHLPIDGGRVTDVNGGAY